MDDPSAVHDLIETRVRVASWNLWWRFGPWEARLPLIVDELRRVDADVVALQEVWITDEGSSSRHIASELGYGHVEAALAEMSPGVLFGNAVLSRWPITGNEWRPLTALEEDDERRLALRADVDGPRGPLQVFSTHLNWRFDHSHVRQAQVRELARFVAESRPRSFPPIVCGDFNAEPRSAEVEMLTGQRDLAEPGFVLVDTWHAAHPNDPGFTWDNANPFVAAQLEWNRRIDYVFAGWAKRGGAGNTLASELIGTHPTGGVWPSDHYGLVSDLRY